MLAGAWEAGRASGSGVAYWAFASTFLAEVTDAHTASGEMTRFEVCSWILFF